MENVRERRAFGQLVPECRARGIGRSVAFELARSGQVETFNIGRRRFVILASLDSLNERAPAFNAQQKAKRHARTAAE